MEIQSEIVQKKEQVSIKIGKNAAIKKIKKNWQLYLVILLPMLYIILFKYVPMFGVIIAFKDYNVVQGIFGSPWVGMKYFNQFFNNPDFWHLIKNTFYVSIYNLAIGFPAPIILALALNEIRNGFFKKMVQMVTFAPYFISTVVMASMIILFLSPDLGIVNHFIKLLGFKPIDFMGNPSDFRSIYVWSQVWQMTGYGAVIYIAALSGISPELYEAAKVDGASRWQKILHVDLPGIMPAIVIMLILNVGQVLNVGFEQIYLLQNSLNLPVSEIISTYVYKIGLINSDFSYSTAIGLFNSVINFALLIIVNQIAKKISETSLW